MQIIETTYLSDRFTPVIGTCPSLPHLPLLRLFVLTILTCRMDNKGIRIVQPKSFSGEGSLAVECAINLRLYLASLTSWAKANKCEPFIRGGLEEHDISYPLKVSKRRPDLSYLDSTREVITTKASPFVPGVPEVIAVNEVLAVVGSPEVLQVVDATGNVITPGRAAVTRVEYVAPVQHAAAIPEVVEVKEVREIVYIFEDKERFQGHAKGAKELADYEFELAVLQENHNALRLQRAESLFACIQSTVTGRALKLVMSSIDEEPLDRCSIVVDLLQSRFNVTSIRELPQLEARFQRPMPKNLDPEEFIADKLIIREMIESLEVEGLAPMTTSDTHLIIKILVWLPSNYAAVISHINNLIDTKGTEEERGRRGRKISDDGMSVHSSTSNDSYQGYQKVTLTLVTRLLRDRYAELLSKGEIVKVSAESVKVYLSTGTTGTSSTGRQPLRKCYRCGNKEHMVKDCPFTEEEVVSLKAKASASGTPFATYLAAYAAGTFKGTCRICMEAGHSFEECPIVVEGRKVTGKPKPPIIPLKKLGGINSMITIVAHNAQSVTTSKHAPMLWMDDSGSASNLVYDSSLLHGVSPIDGVCLGVGSARVTHVGSFIGVGEGIDGAVNPVRLKTVYVLEGLDRNLFGTAHFQRLTNVAFERSGTSPHCTVWDDATRSTGAVSYKLREHGIEPFLWFKFTQSTILTDEDDEWLREAILENATLCETATPSEYGLDNGTYQAAIEVASLEDFTVAEMFPVHSVTLVDDEVNIVSERPLYGLHQSPHHWNSAVDLELN